MNIRPDKLPCPVNITEPINFPRATDMNKLQTEQLLRKEGFTEKEILTLRRYTEKEGCPYSWLLSQLKKRFIIFFIIMMVFLAGLIYMICSSTQEKITLYSLGFLLIFVILYFCIPLKPACKAYKFMKKYGRSL